MNTWTRVTPYGLKQFPAASINAGAFVSASTQARLNALYKGQHDIWIGNQHIITNTDGSIKSVTVDASHKLLNPLNKTTQSLNSAETLSNSSPYNSTIQQQLNKAALPNSQNTNPPANLNNITQPLNTNLLPTPINNKLDALLKSNKIQSGNTETLNAFINSPQQTISVEDTTLFNINRNLAANAQTPLTLNDLDVTESQSLALQRVGLGLNLSEKATNDIAQLKAGLISQTLKQTETVVTQVNARYNPFAAAQQAAGQQNWKQVYIAPVDPEFKVVADTSPGPQSNATDKQDTGNGRSMSYNSQNQSGMMQRRKQFES